MTEPPRIRDATPDDAETVARMANAFNRSLGQGSGRAMTAEGVVADLLARPDLGVRIAERGGRPLGYTLWTAAYETAHAARGLYMTDLWVEPEARRQGVARALVADLARRARDGGGVYVWWIVHPGNAGANAAYDRLTDFRETMLTRAVFDAPFDRLLEEP